MDTPDLGHLVHRLGRHLRGRLAAAGESFGLTPAQAGVVLALAVADGAPLTLRELGAAIDADAATITGLVTRLSAAGWVEVAPNPRDGRSRVVTLTDVAAERAPQLLRQAGGVSAAALAHLPAAEAAALLDTLGRLVAALDAEATR